MRATFFIGSLKEDFKKSNTTKLCVLAAKELKKYNVTSKFRYIRNYHITPGVEFKTNDTDDQMHIFYEDMNNTDIVVLATPTWWGIHSSLCQAWMERIGAYDDMYIKEGMTPLYNKVFGMVATASNDGFQHIQGIFYAFASNLGMTIPPEAHITWGTALKYSGEGKNPSENKETENMIKNACRNWFLWAKTIKDLDLGNKALSINPGRIGLLSNDKLSS